MKSVPSFLRDAWRLSRPYFATSEERWSARGLLAVVIAMNLAIVGINVVLSYWNREFFNALQDKDEGAFIDLLFTWHRTGGGLMPGFVGLVAAYILVAIHRIYFQQTLQIRWRAWMTGQFLQEWLSGRAYYRMTLATDCAAEGTDNPDQRIAEDVRDFVGNTLALGLSFISNVVSLVSFLGILWTLSGTITVLGTSIPGYMLWVALIYAVVGSALTHWIGRPLIPLNFRQQRVEADFRYALVRVRENVEGIALFGGEAEEKANLGARFSGVADNFRAIMRRLRAFSALTFTYGQIATIFPFVVAAPRFFSGALPLGGLTQTADAFGKVQDSLSWFINNYATNRDDTAIGSVASSSLASWRAVVERLSTFEDAVDEAHGLAATGPASREWDCDALGLDHLQLQLPDGTALLGDTSHRFPPGRNVLISGRSGSGKSTLFRALAGLWPFGSGRIELPPGKKMFLPQRAYIPLGTLRHAITYPATSGEHDDAAVRTALHDVGLGKFAARLDTDENWPQLLSGGEQQRVAIARALLARPEWLFLDEATASLDPESEQSLYALLRSRLPGTTIVSIAHRDSLARFHDDRLVFSRNEDGAGTLAPAKVAA